MVLFEIIVKSINKILILILKKFILICTEFIVQHGTTLQRQFNNKYCTYVIYFSLAGHPNDYYKLQTLATGILYYIID